jgi:hypothetical protein
MIILISMIVGVLSLFLFCSLKVAARCDEMMEKMNIYEKK